MAGLEGPKQNPIFRRKNPNHFCLQCYKRGLAYPLFPHNNPTFYRSGRPYFLGLHL